MKKALGIDLGTTFTVMATVDENGKPVIINNAERSSLTPSVIYFGEGEPVVGAEAKRMQAFGENVACFFKRHMGSKNFVLNFRNKDYTATDLSAIILRKVKADAERSLGVNISEAVITVPAYFNNFQREATIKAGEIAGLKVLRIINEPTAAALAYGLKAGPRDQKFIVYDLGGGTFDVTLIHITKDAIKAIATDGNHELGGKDWDIRISDYLAQNFYKDYGADPSKDNISSYDLLLRSEDAKKELSDRRQTRVSITYAGKKGTYELTRTKFEEMTRDLMERTQKLSETVLHDAGIKWKELDGALLVGGSTRMPMVGEYVENMSGKKPIAAVDVDEAVALGAAIQAAIDTKQAQIMFTLVRPVQDIMSHSLGMIAINEDRTRYINSIIIPKNKPIPCKESRPFQLRTSSHRKNYTEVYMLQGESINPLDCIILGKYVFSDISHVPDQIAILDIEYEYDKNGVVRVSATQRQTGGKQALTIEPVPSDIGWVSLPPKEEEIMVHPSVVIAVDISGSMSGDPLTEAQKAAHAFINKIDLTHTSAGLVAFADKANITQELCQDARQLEHGINLWKEWMDKNTLGGGTSGEPFSKSLELLEKAENPRFIIVLTDGLWGHQDEAIHLANECQKKGIDIIAIGLGSADENFLKNIATTEENALYTSLEGLVKSFSKIAQVLTEKVGIRLMDNGTTKQKSTQLKFFEQV